MQVKSIGECSKGRILPYFRPSLSYQLSLRPLFCLFLSGRFTQVLLYVMYLDERIENVLHIPYKSSALFGHIHQMQQNASSDHGIHYLLTENLLNFE